MDFATSIHWHGIIHRGQDVWMDGGSWVTQCPITHAEPFTYEFTIQPNQQPGTYMYHGHIAYQKDMGLSGTLIVLPALGDDGPNGGHLPMCPESDDPPAVYDPAADMPPQEPVECYDGDFIVNVADFSFEQSHARQEHSEHKGEGPRDNYMHRGRIENESIAVINGRGQVTEQTCGVILETANPGAFSVDDDDEWYPPVCDPLMAPFPTTFEVEYGKTYLLRFLHSGRHWDVITYFPDHMMQIVGNGISRADPANHNATSTFTMNPGERVDIVFTANQRPAVYVVDEVRYRGSGTMFHAVWYIKYKSADLYDSSNYVYRDPSLRPSPPRFGIWNEMTLDSAMYPAGMELKPPHPDEVTKKFYIEMTQARLGKDENGIPIRPTEQFLNHTLFDQTCPRDLDNYYTLNGVTGAGTWSRYKGSPLQMLAQMGSLDAAADPSFYEIELGDVVEIAFQTFNTCGGAPSHSLHLHGYNFWVAGHGNGKFIREDFEAAELEKVESGANYGYKTDIIGVYHHDGLSIGQLRGPSTYQGWTVIRFRAEAAGIWQLHCHQTPHTVEGGLLAFFAESMDAIPEPPEGFPMCGEPRVMKEEQKAQELAAVKDTLKRIRKNLRDTEERLEEAAEIIEQCDNRPNPTSTCNAMITGLPKGKRSELLHAVDPCDCEEACRDLMHDAYVWFSNRPFTARREPCMCLSELKRKIKLSHKEPSQFQRINYLF